MTVASVNSALQRARATLDARPPAMAPSELSEKQTRLVAQYVDAFERYDISALGALLHEEATLSMPPYDMWLRGRESISRWMLTFGIGCKGSRLVPVQACGGMPGFAQYRQGGAQPWAVIVLDLRGERIASVTTYLDVETLFPRFGLPKQLAS
jgi:RNA polymerase sigma-70 factor (ECF subfamily)